MNPRSLGRKPGVSRDLRRKGWGWLVLGAALALAAPAGAEEPAEPSAVGAGLVEVCADSPIPELPDLGSDVCQTLDAGVVLLALVCGTLPVDPASCAELTDGRPIDPAAVDAFEQGWVARALRLQARLDEDRPLRDALIPHTHNSFNAPQYGPTLTTSDPNQRYTLTDQLRMGIRALELDVHWLPHPAAAGGHAVVLCHGQTEDLGGLRVHVGCTVDRLLGPGLEEIAAFLAAPGNEREVVLLYLQNELDANPDAHAAAIADLEQHLGPLIARPDGAVAGTCQDLPIERSRADLLAAGHRVLLVGNCGPGPWSSWVFQRGDGWDERANTAGYPAFPDCAADRAARDYDAHLIRVTEDSTWLSAVAASPAPITEAEVRAMVRCGVELIGLDRIGPADPRLAALVWSWAPDEPSAAGPCAAWGTDARFRASDCAPERRAACRVATGAWVVPEQVGPWADGFATCRAAGGTFDVPRSGWDNEQLRAAVAPGTELWLNLGVTATGWTAALASPADLIAPTVVGLELDGTELPATGRASAPWLPVVLLLAAAAARAIASRGRG